ncbi:hypothetical protein PGTUg99_023953 [Puccinia graminis f. sp. tritici]|uniref:Uncharacterized protein n=1 Tax=Puccinia graminis f. sp. tritici TaxID=56615 RepID=A0A5B0R5N7_PUCGR|nr:hypothetical protein PGTUg99_023953 [Puccinia graminis f. sp. tritici]
MKGFLGPACGDCNHLAKPDKIGDPAVPVMMRPGQTSSRRYTVRRPIDSAPISLQGVSLSPAKTHRCDHPKPGIEDSFSRIETFTLWRPSL